MRIGWVMDEVTYKGGAEYDADLLMASAPSGIEVIRAVDRVIPTDVDGYVVGNCVGYGADIIEALERKPVIKRIYDMWPHGNEVLRRWLLDCAQLLIPVSPIQTERASWNAQAPTLCVPCAVEVEQYRVAADAAGNDRYGHVWIGRLFPGKGVGAVQRWADKNRTVVDVYGFGPDLDILEEPCRYGGELEPDAVADTLARYETFVFLPTETDPCPRSVIEAWSAGCELVVNNNVGTLYWIQHEPQALENASVLFWDAVKEVIK